MDKYETLREQLKRNSKVCFPRLRFIRDYWRAIGKEQRRERSLRMTCRSTKLKLAADSGEREDNTLCFCHGSRQALGLRRRVKRGASEPAWM